MVVVVPSYVGTSSPDDRLGDLDSVSDCGDVDDDVPTVNPAAHFRVPPLAGIRGISRWPGAFRGR